MEYTTPMLQVVGTAQSLVLGQPGSQFVDTMTSSPLLEVLGLDE